MGLCPLEGGDQFAIITCPLRLADICCQPKMPSEQRQALRDLTDWGIENQPDDD